MHEHATIDGIVKAILKDPSLKGASKVSEVFLRIGALEFHSEAAFRQGFEVAVQGTVLAGAALRLDVVLPELKCEACGHKDVCREGEVDPHEKLPVRECPKCQSLARISGGRGVDKIELSVEGR
ncbi:MAG: hydrogenase maturation nickel metallochaperone HypA [Elusimicrobia bacterium]|nr:hydrogenase maturation nickel metallochaperone HypA [Elusimicrobiota bacterium]